MLLIFLAVWTAMHVYVFSRSASVPFIREHVPKWVLWSIAVILWPTYIVGRILSQFGAGGIGHAIEYLGATWIGVLFFALVCLFVTDVATGFGFLLPRLAPTLRGLALLVAATFVVIASVQAVRPPVLREYEVQMRNLPPESDGMVLVVASDLHVGALLGTDWLGARVEDIQALRPDLIILAGDIVEGDEQAQRRLVPFFHSLSAPLGVWAVTGNHEYYNGVDRSVRVLEDSGIRVLRDRWAEARPGLIIAGVDDLTIRRRAARDTNFVQQALASKPDGAATILMSHTPLQTEQAANAGVGLMLSGHTHNGQIWPFTYLVQLAFPRVYGDYKVGDMTLIVCRGTGTWGPRMRLWNRSELLRIRLRRT